MQSPDDEIYHPQDKSGACGHSPQADRNSTTRDIVFEISSDLKGRVGNLQDDLSRTASYLNWHSDPSEQRSPANARKKKWFTMPNSKKKSNNLPTSNERGVSREYKAGYLSKITFQWITPLIKIGYKTQLNCGNIWTVHPERSVDPLLKKVKTSFQLGISSGRKYPLLWALYQTFRFEIYLGGICAFISTTLRVMTAFILRFLIQFVAESYGAHSRGRPGPPMSRGVALVIGITLMLVTQSLCTNHFVYHSLLVGGQSRGVLIALIFEKSMVISMNSKAKAGHMNTEASRKQTTNTAEDHNVKQKVSLKTGYSHGKVQEQGNAMEWTNSRITNLVNIDVSRIDKAAGHFHITWTSPLACIFTLIALLINLSYCTLPGFGLLLIGIPMLTVATRALIHQRKVINKITDQRVSLMRETLQSIRTVKYFSWERAFLGRIETIRSKEAIAIRGLLATRNAVSAANAVLPLFASMLSFITYSLTDHVLEPARVFSALTLFNGLRIPLNLLPPVLSQVADAWLSLKRVEKFLLEEEQTIINTNGEDEINSGGVELFNASFSWERSQRQEAISDDEEASKCQKQSRVAIRQDTGMARSMVSEDDDARTLIDRPFELENMSLSVGPNELIAIIGKVGSGKSSLLAAVAGEMPRVAGSVVVSSSKAICPQDPWFQNTTVKKNITFGKQMNKPWYNQVIQACALQPDFDILPDGDETEIGERGIAISGGQRQRMSLARAVYSEADVVLLDDPLSAVDSHVGRHIFNDAILGLLRNKCCIFATHQLWTLPSCDRVIWMEAGQIRANDTFDNLMNQDPEFQVLMKMAVRDTAGQNQGYCMEETSQKLDPRSKPARGGAQVTKEEEPSSATTYRRSYEPYLRASGSLYSGVFVLLTLLITQGAKIMALLWLSYWTANRFNLRNSQYIGIFVGIAIAQAALVFLFSEILVIFGTKASHAMFHGSLTRVLYAPMSFFDTTPQGRIMHHFSYDLDVIDNSLVGNIRVFCFTVAMITSVAALIVAFFPYFAIAIALLIVLFIYAILYYRTSARAIKRTESISRSSVFAKFNECLVGVPSIRTYGLTQQFLKDLFVSIDEMNGSYFLTFANQRWLAIRLDILGNGLVCTVGILAILSRFTVNPSISGLVLSYILAIVQILQFAVRQLTEVENGMTAVEHIHSYSAQFEKSPGYPGQMVKHTTSICRSWPQRGKIVFNGVQMRYRENLPLTLRGLSMHIEPGQRVAIVGRTGAGKSSVSYALFRLVEISTGSITIDGIDISTISLHDLRSRLAIVPQDVTLFQGTIRSNLDPFEEHHDSDLWSALRQANLLPPNTSSPSANNNSENTDDQPQHLHLETAIDEDGRNFSLGQRQLICLARALLRDAKIIICDEATSSVDMETDKLVQRTLASFHGRTIICIAHRLRTILNYDRICVMDAGRVVEFDEPRALWHRGGLFKGLCDQGGVSLEDIQG